MGQETRRFKHRSSQFIGVSVSFTALSTLKFDDDSSTSALDAGRYAGSVRKCVRILAVTLLILTCLCSVNLSSTSAQGTKNAPKEKNDAKSKKGGAAPKPEVDMNDLGLRDFGFNGESDVEDHAVVDPDETSDGQDRLREVSDRARALYVEHTSVERERRPIAEKRDVLAGRLFTLNSVIVENLNVIDQNNQQGKVLEAQIAMAKDPVLIQNLNNLKAANVQLLAVAKTNEAVIAREKPNLDALNIQIKPLDERMRKLWEELNSCRKQWLEIRVPQEKYIRGEYENLKRVINDWARIDGLWVDAFCWGAICDYELGEYETAWDLIEKADKLRLEIYRTKKSPRIDALRGLVSYNIRHLRPKSEGWVQSALGGLDKKTDWETYYLIGLAAAQKPKQGKKAEAFFNSALKIRSRCLSAQYQLALLQTNADSGIANVPEGIKQLESLWTKTGKRSWRIGFSLAKAYKTEGRTKGVDSLLEQLLDIAPVTEHEGLKKALVEAAVGGRDAKVSRSSELVRDKK